MSKRQEIRERRRRERIRNRIIQISLVALGALLVVFAFILPGLRSQQRPQVVITPIAPRTFHVPVSGRSVGEPGAPVKVDVWEDFQCSGCFYYSQNIEPLILTNYVETGKVLYTFHFMPFIDGGAGESQQSANASMCASEQGRFWDYHDILFANWQGENVGAYTDERLIAFAEALDLDMKAFKQCFEANKYANQIQEDARAGSAIGVPPTPGIFVNGQIVTSSKGALYIPSFEEIASAIEAALGGQ